MEHHAERGDERGSAIATAGMMVAVTRRRKRKMTDHQHDSQQQRELNVADGGADVERSFMRSMQPPHLALKGRQHRFDAVHDVHRTASGWRCTARMTPREFVEPGSRGGALHGQPITRVTRQDGPDCRSFGGDDDVEKAWR